MRLLNTASLHLREFIGVNIPPYAILSHTWGTEEFLFEDCSLDGPPLERAKAKAGFSKVRGCCQKAAVDGFEWVWIDSCCINKSSSADLSEAINSMYQWYKKPTGDSRYGRIVSAVKRDAPTWTSEHIPSPVVERGDQFFLPTDFGKSRWFTRGWTLQELIAPETVEFYTGEWAEIGTKTALSERLSKITGIPTEVLRGEASPAAFSVAERMSWASARETTRVEDTAYCLLGIFNINMPLLYGEGLKAFLRLQENIIRQEEDYSVLLWSLKYDSGDLLNGLLAPSPAAFCKSLTEGLQIPKYDLRKARWEWDWREKRYRPSREFYYSDYLGPNGSSLPDRSSSWEPTPDPSWWATYRFIGQKPYEKLRTTKDAACRAPFELRQQEPMSLTGRGLRLTLAMRKPIEEGSPIAIWTNYYLDDGLLCILALPYEQEQKGSDSTTPRRLARFMASWLVTIDVSCLREFEAQTAYCHSGFLMEEEHLQLSGGLGGGVPQSERWGRIKVVLPEPVSDLPTSILSAYPPNSIQLDEVFYRGDEATDGVLLAEHDGMLFTVHYRIVQGKPFCIIPVVWKQRDGKDEPTAFDLNGGDAKVSCCNSLVEDSAWATASDRTVTRVGFREPMVVAAALRKAPCSDRHVSMYTLRVVVCQADNAEPWVQECLALSEQYSGVFLRMPQGQSYVFLARRWLDHRA